MGIEPNDMYTLFCTCNYCKKSNIGTMSHNINKKDEREAFLASHEWKNMKGGKWMCPACQLMSKTLTEQGCKKCPQ